MYFIRMFIVFVLLLAPTLTFAGTVQLPQTGQTSCYHEEFGTVITCTGTGQDGDLRAGVTWPNPRFTDNGDQTVTDNLTGLIWAKDGNAIKTRDPGFDSDFTTGDGMVTWQHALDYIKKLNQENYLGHHDWRLPNVIELESLVHAGQSNSADWLNTKGFSNVQSSYYWSSSSKAAHPTSAWLVNIVDGFVFWFDKSSFPYYSVWPVRSEQPESQGTSIISLPKTGQAMCYDASGSSIACTGTGQDGELQMGVTWPNPRFTDNGDQTVTDNLTGLIWTKDGKTPGPTTCGKGATKSWLGALDYVKCLNTNNYLGYNDWRLPNRKEWRSLVHAGQSNSADWLNTKGFSNVQSSYYWSSSSYAPSPHNSWRISTSDGAMDFASRSFYYPVWPVRSGQSVSFASLIISLFGFGTVTSTPAGISCGTQCRAYFNLGTSVTLTAQASTGSIFAGWSGGDCQGTGICTITLNIDTIVTATFTKEPVGKGDINYDGQVNLTDAVLALQVIASIAPQQIVYKEAYVNGDVKIGLEEVIYILQKVAGMR
ncbi:MAG: DUF1566 domain-containing protein [Deltaproteobacteria bacterium]|nr:DUF1566 domain-containing protein [Deltaproteobacteria bacterium]